MNTTRFQENRMRITEFGRAPEPGSRRRPRTSTKLILSATVALASLLTVPAPIASAAVSGHSAATWNMNGSNDGKWSQVSAAAQTVQVISLQETGTLPGGVKYTGRYWWLPVERPGTTGDWVVGEYLWAAGGGVRYVYYLEMPGTEVRNSLAIVSSEQADQVRIVNPQPWRDGTVASTARPAFGIRLPSDNSYWWTWHAGSGASSGQANDAANMVYKITASMNSTGVASWTIDADFNRDLLNKNSGFTNPPLPDGVRVVNPGNSITRPNASGGTQIDFMVTNDQAKALRAAVTGVFSDHYLVLFGS